MPTQVPFVTTDLFQAIKNRWQTESLDAIITGGVSAGDVKERTKRPYAVVMPLTEVPTLFSNKTQVNDFTFEIEVVVEGWEDCGTVVKRIVAAFTGAPLTLPAVNEAAMVYLFNGQTRYIQEVNFWRAITEFRAEVRQNRLRQQ